jgi:hypothetical protein
MAAYQPVVRVWGTAFCVERCVETFGVCAWRSAWRGVLRGLVCVRGVLRGEEC